MADWQPIIPRPPDLAPLVKAATEALNRAEIAFDKINQKLFCVGFLWGAIAAFCLVMLIFSMLNFLTRKR